MVDVLRWIGALAGLALVLATLGSVINTIILPRSVSSQIAYLTWRAARGSFLFLANRRARYEQKDRTLALLGPVALLAMLAVWLVLFLAGYALMLWPLSGGGTLEDAVRLSGSSLFTLGVASSPRGGATVVEYLGAATGMIIVALQIGYLPTIYSAYNRREMLVTALSARAGAPAWGPEILARHHLAASTPLLPALYASWEGLAADITESHASYPWLMSFRSPNPIHHWVISLLAILDSAALYLALSPSAAPPEARQCLRTGFLAMRALARVTGARVDEDPRPDEPMDLDFEQFSWAVEHLRQVGFPLERRAEEAWPDFRGWRVNYERPAYHLADYVVAVPAPWSGVRSKMTQQDAYDVLANRPRHRTPADPDGRRVGEALTLALQRERIAAGKQPPAGAGPGRTPA